MKRLTSFKEFLQLDESDTRGRTAKGPYRLLYPPQHHAVANQSLPTAENLPGWKAVADAEGVTINSPGGAEKLPDTKTNDACRPKGPDGLKSAELETFK